MTVNRTTLLDLPLPVTGTESGTWGDTTNNGLTQYMDIAIAGMSNLTSSNFTAGALTIETTEGTSAGTNITATSAQYAGFRVSSLATNSTITVGNTGTSPARSYRLINADATYNLTFKATGQTGITLPPGCTAVVAFNGTDYEIVGTIGPIVPIANGGTNATATPTAGGVSYGTGSAYAFTSAGTSGQVLTSNGASAPSWATQVASISFGSTGLTPSTASTGAVTVAGTLAVTNGGTGGTTQATARTGIGASTVGSNFFTLTNPSAITFPRINSDNTVSALDAATFRTAIGAGTGGGSVTSVSGTGTVNGITLSGTVTSSGSLTLGGALSGVSLTSQVSGTLPVANGGTNATATPTAGGVSYGTGSAYAFTSAGTSGQVLTSNGSGAPTWQTLPSGGVSSLTASTGISVSASTGAVTVTNTGVTSLSASTGISVSASTGSSTITNTGVTSLTAGTGISVSASTGGVTVSSTISSGFSNIAVFTSSGTWTVPAGVTKCLVYCTGGGGSGSKTANLSGAGLVGGGAGGTAIKIFTLSGSSATVTVGAGGADANTDNTSGFAGGNSSFVYSSTTITGNGGGAGVYNGYTGAEGGAATGGDINITGGCSSATGVSTTAARSVIGGSSIWGGGAIYGDGPYGSGGSGSQTFSTAGKSGVVVIHY